MKLKGLGIRADIVAGLAIAAATTVVAIVIHKTLTYCSYPNWLPTPPCGHPQDYSLGFRLGVAVSGFVVAALIITGRRYAHRRRGRGGRPT